VQRWTPAEHEAWEQLETAERAVELARQHFLDVSNRARRVRDGHLRLLAVHRDEIDGESMCAGERPRADRT
jgi:hypothetical protein